MFAAPGVGHAAGADGHTVIVAPDERSLQNRNSDLRIARLEWLVRDALPSSKEIEIVTDNASVSVYVTDLAQDRKFVEQVEQYVSATPQLVLSSHQATIWRINYSSDALSKFSGGDPAPGKRGLEALLHPTPSFAGDAVALEQFVRQLRPPLPGIEIETLQDGAIVRADSSSTALQLSNLIPGQFGDVFVATRLADAEWRIGLSPVAAGALGPARSLLASARTSDYVSSVLRDPVDLDVRQTGEGVEVTIIDPEEHNAFSERLESAFAGSPDFVLTSQQSQVLRISLTNKASERAAAPETLAALGPPQPLVDAASALQGLADPPMDFTATGDGVLVRTRRPAQSVDWAARVRRSLASRSDVVIATQPDQSLLISFASGAPAATPVTEDRITRAVQARASALGLQSARIAAVGENRVAVGFVSRQAAATFKQSFAKHLGFAIRMVDDGGLGESRLPPSPGDERLPQKDGGYLWLRPQAAITGDMIEDVSGGVDAMAGQPDINFRLTDEGRERFAAATEANVRHRFAIVLDGVILSAPRIEDGITGGAGEIIANFTADSARSLAETITRYRDELPLVVVGE